MPYFPAEHPLKKEEYPFAAHLGAALIQWNATEWTVRELLLVLTKNMNLQAPQGSWLMVVELGSRQLSQAIQTYANETLKGAESEAVVHITLMYDRLLAYRNYYAHGIISIRPIEPVRTGVVSSMSAKGKMVAYSDEITIAQLGEFITSADTLRRYIFAVQLSLIDTRHHPGVAKPLPEKPLLPATLTKRRPEPPPWQLQPPPSKG